VNQNKLELFSASRRATRDREEAKHQVDAQTNKVGKKRERKERGDGERGGTGRALGPRCCCLLRFFFALALFFSTHQTSKCPRMFRRSPAKVKSRAATFAFCSHGPVIFFHRPHGMPLGWLALRCVYLFSLKSASSGFFSSPCACWLPCAEPLL
jgi:hypothetical protein